MNGRPSWVLLDAISIGQQQHRRASDCQRCRHATCGNLHPITTWYADRAGACAVIEFLDGGMVTYTGENLPVRSLTNSAYPDSINAWNGNVFGDGQVDDNSLWRFTTVARRLAVFDPTVSRDAVAYAFDNALGGFREDTVWSFVFDPVNLRVHFRTKRQSKYPLPGFASLIFLVALRSGCWMFMQMLQAMSAMSSLIYPCCKFGPHSEIFLLSMKATPCLPSWWMHYSGHWKLSMQEGDISTQYTCPLYHPLLPVTGNWAGLMISAPRGRSGFPLWHSRWDMLSGAW